MHFLRRLRARFAPLPAIDAPLWLTALAPYPFLTALSLAEQARLRALAALFLQRKEFSGAHGLEVSDAMALQIAAQACLPLLHLGTPEEAIAWYDDFVGIVVQPGDALARRSAIDEAGSKDVLKPGQRISKKRVPAPLQALGFTLDELREARLAPIVDFKGRGTKPGEPG